MTCENINLLPWRAVNLERQSIIHQGLLSQTSPAFSLTHFLTYTQREKERSAHKTLYSPIVWALLSCLVMSDFPFIVMEKYSPRGSKEGEVFFSFFLFYFLDSILFSSRFIDIINIQHWVSLRWTAWCFDLPTSWGDDHRKFGAHPSFLTDSKIKKERSSCYGIVG